MNGYRELSVEELHRWRARGEPHTLLDVREERELQIAALEGALHIALNELPARIDAIPADRPVVVMCHHGWRSGQGAGFLAARGFETVYNLEGGIDAYACRVDPTLLRY